MIPKKICPQCNQSFQPAKTLQVYCSTDCGYEMRKKRQLGRNMKLPPMGRNQAMANAYLMDRSLNSVDELIESVFDRKLGE